MRIRGMGSQGLRLATDALAVAFLSERERWPLWAPVLIGAGIAAYFALAFEPAPWTGAAALAGLAVGGWTLRRRDSAVLAVTGLFLLALGFAAAQLRSHTVAAPVLDRPTTASVSGRVRALELFPGGPRALLDRVALRTRAAQDTPERVRIRLRAGDRPAVGARIVVFARLMPPSPPAMPGAYDFQRSAWFARIGAVGYAYGAAREIESEPATLWDSAALWISTVRQRVAERVRASVPGPSGAVAAALITGDRSAIPKDVIEAMRHSGLAHLLAISGLHMGLVAATLFFGLRALLAIGERLALRHPIKKWAAAAALLGAFGYLLLTGATIPTQRAFLMAGLVLAAVLLDRTAISLRLVAWAAAAILLTTPESLLSASFQMSFAAVVALGAVYEGRRDGMKRWSAPDGFRKPLHYLAGVSLTAVVAGAATGVFAIYHFGQIAHFGVAANLLAVPVTAFWIMPWAVIGLVLMPIGLEHLALAPMGLGIDLVVAVARTVADWPGAVSLTPAMPSYGLIAAALGGLWLCLWRRRWRFLGIAGIAAGLSSVAFVSAPDVLVSSDGRLMAIKSPDGTLALSSVRREKRIAQRWMARAGQRAPQSLRAGVETVSCDGLACIYRAKSRIVSLVADPRALEEDCRRADVVISAVPVRWDCPSAQLVVDRFDVWRRGGHAVWLAREGARAETVAEWQGNRPWAPKRQRRSKPNSGAGARSAALAP